MCNEGQFNYSIRDKIDSSDHAVSFEDVSLFKKNNNLGNEFANLDIMNSKESVFDSENGMKYTSYVAKYFEFDLKDNQFENYIDNYFSTENSSGLNTFLFRAEIKTEDNILSKIDGDVMEAATLEKLSRLSQIYSSETFTNDSIMVNVYKVDFAREEITVKNDGSYVKVNFDDIKKIRVPQIYELDNNKLNGIKMDNLRNAMANFKPSRVSIAVESPLYYENKKTLDMSHMHVQQKAGVFEISSANSDMESELEEEMVDDGGYSTSWSKPMEKTIALWATSSSSDEKSSDAKELYAVSSSSENEMDVVEEQVNSNWAETSDSKNSSSDMAAWVEESDSNLSKQSEDEMGGWVETSDSKNSGGFASSTSESNKSTNLGGFISSSTSDNDNDDLAAIISKIEREEESKNVWEDDSETE